MSEENYLKVFICPNCGKRLSIDALKEFKAGLCPNCKVRVEIPKIDSKSE